MRTNTRKIVVSSLLATLTLLIVSTSMIYNVYAYTFPRSVNVAMVPGPTASTGGTLYTGGTWPDGLSFNFNNLSPGSIADGTNPNPLTGYDTVMIMSTNFNFATYWTDPDFSSRITSFVNGGGKLIIYTSETTYLNAFASFIYPFTITNPGQTGSFSGTLVNLAADTLSSNNAAADTYPNGLQSYINLPLIVSQTDAVGDLTVMTSYNPNWYIDMTGINVQQKGGPAHTYAFYGAGLIIFNGLDIDYAGGVVPNNSGGDHAIQMVWWRELCGQTLGPGQSVSGLTLTPATATNSPGTTHTVTALVSDTILNPIPGVVVTFTIISGPSVGTTGQATTDTNGEATFSWSSAVPGTDVVQASITNAAGAPITTTATKTWELQNQIPEVPLGTIAVIAAMFLALAFFMKNAKAGKQIRI